VNIKKDSFKQHKKEKSGEELAIKSLKIQALFFSNQLHLIAPSLSSSSPHFKQIADEIHN
jgi:hypothetical protein